MNLTEIDLQEIKAFLEDNLHQNIDVRLINSMKWNTVLSKFFHDQLKPFIKPDTSDLVCNWIDSLNMKEVNKFKFIPFFFCHVKY